MNVKVPINNNSYTGHENKTSTTGILLKQGDFTIYKKGSLTCGLIGFMFLIRNKDLMLNTHGSMANPVLHEEVPFTIQILNLILNKNK